MYFSSPKWNYEVLGGQYNTKADAALGIGYIWIYGDILYQCQFNRNNILTFEIKVAFQSIFIVAERQHASIVQCVKCVIRNMVN